MKNKIYSLLFVSIALLSACSTKLDVTGSYKETMVVYGLLDQSQPKQYIKINKAFLGEGNAFTYAKIKDSTQYVNALTVKLKRLSDNTEYTLTPDNSIQKSPGTFYGPDQTNAIYSFNSTGPAALTAASNYELTIKNSETGTQVSSQTSLITDVNFNSPSPVVPAFGFLFANNDNYEYQVRWTSGLNARLYQVVIRLNYIDSLASGNVTQSLDWVFPELTTQSLAGGEDMKNDFVGQNFMRFIGNQLHDYTGLLARRALKVDLILIAGGDELSTFIDVNKPSTSIVQQKPIYTNITNGLGVFSSRYNKPPLSKFLAKTTWDSLACGRYTNSLKFLNSLGHVCQ